MAAAGGGPRAAGAARLVVAGGVRAARGVGGGGRERRGGRVGAGGAGGAGGVRALRGRRPLAGRRRVRLAHDAGERPCVRLVGAARPRAGRLRHRLPPVHRAAGRDLGPHEPSREPAADGLLAELPRGRLRHVEALLRHVTGHALPAGGAGGELPRAGARGGRVPGRAQVALRPVLPGAAAGRSGRDERRLSARDSAAPGPDVHLQPPRPRPVPANDAQGGPAGGDRPGVPGRIRRGGRVEACPPRGRRGPGGGRSRVAPRVRVAAHPRAGGGRSGRLRRSAPGLEGRRAGARPRPAGEQPGHGAAGRAVRLLRLGRHRGPDPARAHRPAGRGAPVRAPCRPACGGSAVDGGCAPAAGAAGPRSAAPAARAARRGRGGDRRGRRHLAQRSGARGRRRGLAGGARRPHRGVRAQPARGRDRRRLRARPGAAARAPHGPRPGTTDRARAARRSADDRGRFRRCHRRAGGLRRSARPAAARVRGGPGDGAPQAGRALGLGDRDLRFQPPARVRGGAAAPEHRRDPRARRPDQRRRRDPRCLRRGRQRRSDGRPARRGPPPARPVLPRVPAVSRAPALCRRGRRRAHRMARGQPPR